MGLFDKATDKLMGLKYENIEYERMLSMVQEYFITLLLMMNIT